MLLRLCAILIASITISCGKFESHKAGSNAFSSVDAATAAESCPNRLGGTWGEPGRIPYGCALPASMTASLHAQNAAYVVDDAKDKKPETHRYAKVMYVLLTNYSVAYFQRREPGATAADVQGWLDLTLTMFYQESGWTQYRLGKDGLFRFFKGDSYNGFGIGQIDRRSHKKFIQTGQVYEMGPHITYAFDLIYKNRKKAKEKPCAGKTDIESLNRSAWAMYNGGPGSKCRWTYNSKWAENDRGFFQKYKDQPWEKFLAAN